MIPEFDPFKTPALVEDYRGGLTPVKILSGPHVRDAMLPHRTVFRVRSAGRRAGLFAAFEPDPYPKGFEFDADVEHTLPRKSLYVPEGSYYCRVKPHKWKGT